MDLAISPSPILPQAYAAYDASSSGETPVGVGGSYPDGPQVRLLSTQRQAWAPAGAPPPRPIQPIQAQHAFWQYPQPAPPPFDAPPYLAQPMQPQHPPSHPPTPSYMALAPPLAHWTPPPAPERNSSGQYIPYTLAPPPAQIQPPRPVQMPSSVFAFQAPPYTSPLGPPRLEEQQNPTLRMSPSTSNDSQESVPDPQFPPVAHVDQVTQAAGTQFQALPYSQTPHDAEHIDIHAHGERQMQTEDMCRIPTNSTAVPDLTQSVRPSPSLDDVLETPPSDTGEEGLDAPGVVQPSPLPPPAGLGARQQGGGSGSGSDGELQHAQARSLQLGSPMPIYSSPDSILENEGSVSSAPSLSPPETNAAAEQISHVSPQTLNASSQSNDVSPSSSTGVLPSTENVREAWEDLCNALCSQAASSAAWREVLLPLFTPDARIIIVLLGDDGIRQFHLLAVNFPSFMATMASSGLELRLIDADELEDSIEDGVASLESMDVEFHWEGPKTHLLWYTAISSSWIQLPDGRTVVQELNISVLEHEGSAQVGEWGVPPGPLKVLELADQMEKFLPVMQRVARDPAPQASLSNYLRFLPARARAMATAQTGPATIDT